MEHIKTIYAPDIEKNCFFGDCGECQSVCQSNFKVSSGMAVHKCKNPNNNKPFKLSIKENSPE
jgi:predicted ribosomally synthesized six-cysteine peptide SCIFF